MKPARILITALLICASLALGARAAAPDLAFVTMGKVIAVNGRTVTFATPQGQQGSMELSPTATFHNASLPPPALADLSQLRQGDIFVVTTDTARKTHIIIVHVQDPPQPDWDALFARIVPGYHSATQRQQQNPAAQGGMRPGALKLVDGMMGTVTHTEGNAFTLKKQGGESMNITLPANATLHDIAEPVSSTRPVQIQTGDDIMLTVDGAERPHVLILHPRQSIDASWKGVVGN